MDHKSPTFAELLEELSTVTIRGWSEYPSINWIPSSHQLNNGHWVKQNTPETLAHWAKEVEKIADAWEHPSPAQVIRQAAHIAAHAAKVARIDRDDYIQAIKTTSQDAKQTAKELQQRAADGNRWDHNGPFLLDAEQHARLERAWHIINFFRQAETQTMAELYAPFIGSVNSQDTDTQPSQPNLEDQAIRRLIYAEHSGHHRSHLEQPELP